MFPSPRDRGSRANRALRPLVTTLAFLAALAAPATVAAHAELDKITPADKAATAGSPAEIVATFTEALDAGASSLKIVDAANNVIVEGSTVGSDGKTMTLPIPTPLAPGAYTVRWTSKSAADGDLDHGTTTFTVAAAPPSVSPTPEPSSPASVAPSVSPSAAPTVAPSPSAGPTTPTASTSDALIPIIVVLVLIAAAGAWLLRGRSRATR